MSSEILILTADSTDSHGFFGATEDHIHPPSLRDCGGQGEFLDRRKDIFEATEDTDLQSFRDSYE